MSNWNPTFLLGSHPSRLSLLTLLLSSSQVLSRALSSLHHRSTTRTPWLSSVRPLFTFFPSRPARLSRILFPWFTRPSRKRGEFPRLSTVLFPILFPFLSFSHLCLFILSVHRFLSFSIAANAVKDGNVDKTACCRRCLDNVIYMYAIVKEESRPFNKHYDTSDKLIIILASWIVKVSEPLYYKIQTYENSYKITIGKIHWYSIFFILKINFFNYF